MRKEILSGFVTILILFSMVNFVIAEMLVSDVGVIYDSEIETLFDSQSEVYVTVMLKVPDNIKYDETMSKEEISAMFEKRKQDFEQIQSNLLSTLTASDFKLIKTYSTINGFRGNITKSGFEKLKNNPDVLSIHIPLEGSYLLFEEEQLGTLKYCKDNSECVIVQNGCCDCNNNGKVIPINKNYQDYWNKNLKELCGGIGCYPFISEDISCSFNEAKCIYNQCVFEGEEIIKNDSAYKYLVLSLIIFIIVLYLLIKNKK